MEDTLIASDPAPVQLTPLDWNIAYNRTGLHLSNQLRGKRFNSEQLDLFDDYMDRLPAEIQVEAMRANIDVIGFSLSVPQQQAFEAALFLINASNRQRQIRIKPDDWLRAYQLRSYKHGSGREFTSYRQRDDALRALVALSMKPFLMHYQKRVGLQDHRETRIAPLWQLRFSHVQSIPQPAALEEISADYVGKAAWFELHFDDIWFDQIDNFYFYKPRDLFQRIHQATLPGETLRIPPSLHPFLEWVFAEAGRLRNELKNTESPVYILRANWHEVALQSRLRGQFKKRNHKRAKEMLIRNAKLAEKAGILDSFRFDGDMFVAAVNPAQFEELEEYLQERRRQPNKKNSKGLTPDALPWDPADLTPFQMKELIKEWKEECDRLRRAIPPDKHQAQIDRLTKWIKAYYDYRLGRNTGE